MSVTSNRKITIILTGDVEYSQIFSAAANTSSPGDNSLANMTTGANTITVPSGSVGVTILPPTGNTVAITLKGVSGDTGIALHPTDPTSLAVTGVSSFVINAASAITGVRFIFT